MRLYIGLQNILRLRNHLVPFEHMNAVLISSLSPYRNTKINDFSVMRNYPNALHHKSQPTARVNEFTLNLDQY